MKRRLRLGAIIIAGLFLLQPALFYVHLLSHDFEEHSNELTIKHESDGFCSTCYNFLNSSGELNEDQATEIALLQETPVVLSASSALGESPLQPSLRGPPNC